MRIPNKAIDVLEQGCKPRRGRSGFSLSDDFVFSTRALEAYAFASWRPVIYDAMVVAASIEYADRTYSRPSMGWRRNFELRIPVMEPTRWRDGSVSNALRDAASFLTGDGWQFDFVQRRSAPPTPSEDSLPFDPDTAAVIAFSDGLDSRAVAHLEAETYGSRLARVRVASKAIGRSSPNPRAPFMVVPYTVKTRGESSARSRGLKFAIVSGIAAYLSGAPTVILTESGQGVFGPALAATAHAYPDYRSHPLFTKRVERFLAALLRTSIGFTFPRLWSTKGETIRAYAQLSGSDDWRSTRSCWRDARHCSIEGRRAQCGICAACMLRRMSLHAAGLVEHDANYVCQNLGASSLTSALHPHFTRQNRAFEEYAIAGVQHMAHLAQLSQPSGRRALRRHAIVLADTLQTSPTEVEEKLVGMFERHSQEWSRFLNSVGGGSFMRGWLRGSA